MRLRFVAIFAVVFLSVLAVYNLCQEGGAIDTIVGIARRITYGALMAVGFCTASLVLRKWMSQPLRPISPTGQAAPPPPVPTFGINQTGNGIRSNGMHSDPGTGKFRVSGVDHDTQFVTSEIVYADSASSAKLKVELKGVDVQTVEPV